MSTQKQDTLLNKVYSHFSELGLLCPCNPLVLMVSGGSDSVALARLACAVCDDTAALLVVHVNHQLRGAAADADEEFVQGLCSELGLRCVVHRLDVAAEAAKTGESVEQTGRRLRYAVAESALQSLMPEDALADIHDSQEGSTPKPSTQHAANRNPSDSQAIERGFILTAHTADDRAETLLQRLIVGGGGSSLASIPWRNGRVVRPLLDCTRQELRSWIKAQDKQVNGAYWCEDATNDDTYYSRAFVRHELLPLLAERNPRIIESLNRTADVLSSESAWMDERARELLPLTLETFEAPEPLLRRAVYLACNEAIEALSPGARVTYDHIDLIASKGNQSGFACQIPGGIEVRNARGAITFAKAKPPKHDPRQEPSA